MNSKEISSHIASLIEITQEQDPNAAQIQLMQDVRDRPEEDQRRISHGINLAKRLHHGQKRLTGVEYIIHPLHVARADLRINPQASTESILVKLLHDGIEDTTSHFQTISDIKNEAGERVLFGVDALSRVKTVNGKRTKISDHDYYSRMLKADQQDPDLDLVTGKAYADRGVNLFDPPFLTTLPERGRENLKKKRMKTIVNTEKYLIPLLLSDKPDLQEMLNAAVDLSKKTLSPDFGPDNWREKL
jgi:(p)ppGpp synthase/HD superfamily hydrolase